MNPTWFAKHCHFAGTLHMFFWWPKNPWEPISGRCHLPVTLTHQVHQIGRKAMRNSSTPRCRGNGPKTEGFLFEDERKDGTKWIECIPCWCKKLVVNSCKYNKLVVYMFICICIDKWVHAQRSRSPNGMVAPPPPHTHTHTPTVLEFFVRYTNHTGGS